MSDFAVGNTVRLKCGGPLMSVGAVTGSAGDEDGVLVKCDWTDKTDKPQSVVYRQEQIELDDGSVGGFFAG
ncbi:DUF2158 domain-containing protein [Pseudomonas koreensis]|uniref:DUF2158 domain-containing protein n=1 Tax=Pseudomonas koreensis TaxID=198620 RepID=UPI003F834639